MIPVDEHPVEDLSALLDGELGVDDEQALQAHLATCRSCAEELHWIRATRLALRTLPAVEVAPTVVSELLERTRAVLDDHPRPSGSGDVVPLSRRRRRTAPAVASVAATVTMVVLGLSVLDSGPYRPALSAAVESHAASVQAMAAGGRLAADGGNDPLRPAGPVVPTTALPRDLADLPAPYAAPDRLEGGYRLVDAFTDPGRPDVLQLLYERGRYGLSVFQTPGHLDFAALPAGGSRLDVGGAEGWRWETPDVGGRVVVYERDGLVVTVVGDERGDAVLRAARSLPPPRPRSAGQRVRDLGVEVLEALSP